MTKRLHPQLRLATPPLAPWKERRLTLLRGIESHDVRWYDWHWGTSQWEADLARAMKDGLVVVDPRPGPPLRVHQRQWYGTLIHSSNRPAGRTTYSLTDAGRALIATPPPPEPTPGPYARRKAAIAEFLHLNRRGPKP